MTQLELRTLGRDVEMSITGSIRFLSRTRSLERTLVSFLPFLVIALLSGIAILFRATTVGRGESLLVVVALGVVGAELVVAFILYGQRKRSLLHQSDEWTWFARAMLPTQPGIDGRRSALPPGIINFYVSDEKVLVRSDSDSRFDIQSEVERLDIAATQSGKLVSVSFVAEGATYHPQYARGRIERPPARS